MSGYPSFRQLLNNMTHLTSKGLYVCVSNNKVVESGCTCTGLLSTLEEAPSFCQLFGKLKMTHRGRVYLYWSAEHRHRHRLEGSLLSGCPILQCYVSFSR